MNGRTAGRRKLGNSTERQIRERHMRRIRQMQRRRVILRSSLLIICVVILLSVIVFMTPLFNVREVTVEGNERVSTEALVEQLPFQAGENLFKISEGAVKSKLSGISYIRDVQVEKDFFPPKIHIIVSEKKPVAAIAMNGAYGVIDIKCEVLEEGSEIPQGIPELVYYHEDAAALKEDSDAIYELTRFFEIADKIGLTDKITGMELLEDNEINFQYDGRLKIICGSGLDMEKKLPLLKETVNNPALGSNAHGEIDLSTPGKAVHRS